MIAAIYARKSNEQNGVADEAKSVSRQIEQARAFAASRDWAVDENHIYVDDAISGAEFTKRPGYVRLLNALKPRAPFDVLIVMHQDRLGREQFEVGYGLKQLAQAGVRLFSYVHEREIAMETATDKFLLTAVNYAAEVEREKARERVCDTMLRKARKGHLCGGACFGYVNVAVTGLDGRRSHVDRAVDQEQAVVVRRIFEMCAAGLGVKRIAKTLNREGVAAPRPQRGRPRAWAPSSVRALLHREAYRGIYVYNATKQSDAWGQRTLEKRHEGEIVRVSVPHWRIVEDGLWHAAHRRLDTAAQVYLRGTNGQVWGRPPSELTSKYLLSGKLRCACCGASMTVRSRAQSGKRFYYYVCASYDTKGKDVCGNSLLLPMKGAHDEIIGKVSSLLDPEIVEGALADAVDALRAGFGGDEGRREALRRDVEATLAEQGRLVEAIARTDDIGVLTQALKDRERRRVHLEQELAALEAREQLKSFDSSAVARDLRRRVDDWRGLVQRNTPIARQVLDRILADRIAWTPHRDEGVYEYAGRLQFDRVLAGMVATDQAAKPKRTSKPTNVTEGGTSPTGFEPVFWP